MTQGGRMNYSNMDGGLGCGCGPMLGVYMMIVVLAVLGLSSCRTVSEHDSYAERHRIETMMNRMDSVISKSQTVQQDSSWRETVIRQLESIKERNDTNRTVVLDTAGNVIRETITIIREREVSSESDRLEREGMRHSIEKMDSTISVQNEKLSRMDSLLQERTKEKVVEKKTPWYQRLWNGFRFILIGLVAGIVVAVLTGRLWKSWLDRLKKAFHT